MAVSILGLLTFNGKYLLEVDKDPSTDGGLAAPLGSLASLDTGSSAGQEYVKIGPNDTDWDLVMTKTQGSVAQGNLLSIPIYDLSPNGYHVGPSALQNTKAISLAVVTQASRSQNIQYLIPNPGDAVTSAYFVLTEGAQTINGAKTFGSDMVINGNLTVNGSLVYNNVTQMQITDPLITLNKGGGAGTGGGVGFEIEEDSVITGYFKTTADRAGYAFLAPATTFAWTLDFSALAASRIVKAPDSAGFMVLRPSATTQVAGQVSYWADGNQVTSESNFFWDATNHRLSIGSGNAPTDTLDITGTLRMRSLTLGSVAYVGANGVISQDNANFFWDGTNHRLGLGTTLPSRLLDVKGTSLFQSSIRQADLTATKANWEQFQAQVSTTDATVTTLASVSVPADTGMLITFRVVGRNTTSGNGVAYSRTVRAQNVSGTVTIGAVQADYTSEGSGMGAANITVDVSGTAVRARVAGLAGITVDWAVTYQVQTLS